MLEFLTSVLGGTIKSLATKALTGPLEELARQLSADADAHPIDQTRRAVASAVEAARKDLVNGYWKGEDEHSREVVALLRYRPFVEEVGRRLLMGGQPDFVRLERHSGMRSWPASAAWPAVGCWRRATHRWKRAAWHPMTCGGR